MGDDPRNQDLGTFPTFDAFLKAHPELTSAGHNAVKLSAQGLIVNTIPTDNKGVAQGVHIWRIDPNWKNGTTQKDMQYRQATGDGGFKAQTLPAGRNKNGDVLSLLQHDGYGALAVQEAEGPKNHEEAVAHLANGTDEQQAQAQRFLDTEETGFQKETRSQSWKIPRQCWRGKMLLRQSRN